MTPKDLKAALADLAWTQGRFARRIRTHPNTVSKWITGQARIPGAVAAYLDLARSVQALQSQLAA